MLQIALISHQHDDDVAVRVLPQLIQPSPHVDKGLLLADVVHQKRADRPAVVGRRDGAVALLAGGVPNLCLDSLRVDLDASRGELYADGGLGVEVELVAREPAEQVGFTDARVSDQDDCGGVWSATTLTEVARWAVSTFEEELQARTSVNCRNGMGVYLRGGRSHHIHRSPYWTWAPKGVL